MYEINKPSLSIEVYNHIPEQHVSSHSLFNYF